MFKRSRLLLGLVLIIAALLTFYKIPIASSQGLTLVSAAVEGDLPLTDPDSALWNQATAVDVPLSAQNVTKPFLLESKIKSLTARSIQNGSQIAFLVAWEDDSKNDSLVRVQDFRDSVALQFPLAEGQPFFCMGQQGGNVNLWHWKADWQADLTARQDMDTEYSNMYADLYPFADPAKGIQAGVADYADPNYIPAMASGNLFAVPVHASPIEDLIAGGFGSLTAQAADNQNVMGFGVWEAGNWRVIFSRDLASSETVDVTFVPGKTYSVAFAVWDGANGERNGQKSTSQWVNLQFGSAPRPAAVEEQVKPQKPWWQTTQVITLVMFGVLAVLFIVGALIYSRLPE